MEYQHDLGPTIFGIGAWPGFGILWISAWPGVGIFGIDGLGRSAVRCRALDRDPWQLSNSFRYLISKVTTRAASFTGFVVARDLDS